MTMLHRGVFLVLPGFWIPAILAGSLTQETLPGAHGAQFGMGSEEVVESVLKGYGMHPSRQIEGPSGRIVEYDDLKTPEGRIATLRLFVHPENGLFWVEEEHVMRWDLQSPDAENLAGHGKMLARLLGILRSRYGPERFMEQTDLSRPFYPEDFVTASWRFAGDRWIHLIFEPQDWSLLPELNNFVVIYRDSARDPR